MNYQEAEKYEILADVVLHEADALEAARMKARQAEINFDAAQNDMAEFLKDMGDKYGVEEIARELGGGE